MLNQNREFWENVAGKVRTMSVSPETDYFEFIENYRGRFFEKAPCALNTNANPDIVIWAILETLKEAANEDYSISNLSRDELGKDGKLYY